MIEQAITKAITASPVSESRRINFVPNKLPKYFLQFEGLLFDWAGRGIEHYSGGYWDFFELSNGGFYWALNDTENHYSFTSINGYSHPGLSADVIGIIVTLYALCHLAEIAHTKGDEGHADTIIKHYYKLRDFASEHSEAGVIFRAID